MNDNNETWIELAALTRNVISFLKIEKRGSSANAANEPLVSGTEGRPCTGLGKDVTAGEGLGGKTSPAVTLTPSWLPSVTEFVIPNPADLRDVSKCAMTQRRNESFLSMSESTCQYFASCFECSDCHKPDQRATQCGALNGNFAGLPALCAGLFGCWLFKAKNTWVGFFAQRRQGAADDQKAILRYPPALTPIAYSGRSYAHQGGGGGRSAKCFDNVVN